MASGNSWLLRALAVPVLLAWTGGPLVVADGAFAQDVKPKSSASEVEIPETTEVGGEIPTEFLGRWVAFATVKIPSGLLRHFSRMWEIREGPEHFEIVLRHTNIPNEVNKRLQQATKDSKEFKVTPEELQLITEQWDTLHSNKPIHTKIENKLLAADAYPPEFVRDVVTKDSMYAIVFNEFFKGGGVTRTYSIYAVRKREPDHLSGTFITTSMAVAPFPIPITLKGDFDAYRVGAPEERSFLQRLGDMFSGCGGSD
jgi:hypothetical protein